MQLSLASQLVHAQFVHEFELRLVPGTLRTVTFRISISYLVCNALVFCIGHNHEEVGLMFQNYPSHSLVTEVITPWLIIKQ